MGAGLQEDQCIAIEERKQEINISIRVYWKDMELGIFTYGSTMGKDSVDSKEVFHKYVSVKYRVGVRDSLKKGKQCAYKNHGPKYIPEDATITVNVWGAVVI